MILNVLEKARCDAGMTKPALARKADVRPNVMTWADRLDASAKALSRGDLRAYRIGRAIRIGKQQVSTYLEGDTING